MSIILDGTTGITTPGLTNTGTETILNLTTTGNTILGDATTDTLNVGAGGLVKDSSGNVGVGTASPSSYGKLAVYGGDGLTIVGSGTESYLQNWASATNYVSFKNASGSENGTILYSQASNYMAFKTSSTERMRLDSSGNLGLGVTPSSVLSGYKFIQIGSTGVNYFGGSASTGFNYNGYYNAGWKYNSTGNATLYDTDGSSHKWHIAPSGTAGNAITFTQAMTLDASGNLGIGTSSPNTQLAVVSSSATAYSSSSLFTYTNLSVYNGANGGYSQIRLGATSATSGQGCYAAIAAISTAASDTNTALTFMTRGSGGDNGPERMRIDSSGNVLFGTTGVPNGTSVYGSAFVPISYGRSRLAMATSDTGDLQLVQFFNPNGQVGAINTNSSETDYYTTSSSTTGAVLVRNGVQFPASQVASSNANTLDDYEEGTFTATFTAQGSPQPTCTYSYQSGRYIKVGKLVYYTIRMGLTAVSNTAAVLLQVSGLPFTPVNASNAYPGALVNYKAGWTTNGPDYGRVLAGATDIEMYLDNNTSESNINTNNLSSSLSLIITGCYEATA